ncbi:MAG: hypothetical protein AB1700_06290 [Bacillota bacterium]
MRQTLLVATLACLLLIGVAFTAGGPAAADTGTYRILRYTVSIEPQPDGSWIAEYSQEWKVIGGRIPWVTVGLPHSDYAILSSSGAASSVSRADEGSWSGVRVGLDQDYRSGETFAFSFRVRQARMGYRKADAVEFSFVPGWYDRADTERLEIRLRNPGAPEDLLFASPTPSNKTAGEAIWVARLGRGERFRVSFAFSPGLFPDLSERRAPAVPNGIPRDSTGAPFDSAGSPASVLMSVIIVLFVLLIAMSALARATRGGYRGRRGIHYGSYFPLPPVGRPPAGSGTTRPSGGSRSSGGSRRSGGGGGFGGRSIGCACVACACACVSCACACACAGGSGAGCARKFDGSQPRRQAAKEADTG